MVGLVLVSHSHDLALAALALVRQVAGPDVRIATAGGVGEQREEFGTDAVEISEAIQSVYSIAGVVVIMDLGSAILSAEVALDLLPEEMRSGVHLCPAPFIEGAISAAVQAGLDANAETVCQEATQALRPKAEQLSPGVAAGAPMAASEDFRKADKKTSPEIYVILHNPHGLHARPAARFVQMAASFDAEIQVWNITKAKGPVSARSLNALATLGAVEGDEVAMAGSGRQAGEALDALKQLVEQNFGEHPEPASGRPLETLERTPARPPGLGRLQPETEGVLQGIPVSEGIATGPLAIFKLPVPVIPTHTVADPLAAVDRLDAARKEVSRQINKRRAEVARAAGEPEAEIFDAHLLILNDPELVQRAREYIEASYMNEAAAWDAAINQAAEAYERLEDPYLRQRAADVRDVGLQVVSALLDDPASQPRIEKIAEPYILYAYDLNPTQTAQLDLEQVVGLVTVIGGPTSHSAILARARGIPAVIGGEIGLENVDVGTTIAIDGFTGQIWIAPSKETLNQLEIGRKDWLEERRRLIQASQEPVRTRDGSRIEIAANAGGLEDAVLAGQNGAEGIGLLRTEFLFMTRKTPPSEDEQALVIGKIADVMGDRPVIVRTLDVGGDKPLPYVDMPRESNPFLGVRGLRLMLRTPDLFTIQLKAILRAANNRPGIQVMFPMVTSVDEVEEARQMLAQSHEALARDSIPHRWPIRVGIMVETPASALLADVFARQVDFFSIGTNDLTQYTLAAERGNPALSAYADALHPAVLRLIHSVVRAAHGQQRWVGVCGESAGDPVAAPVLLGLQVDELSMNPGAIPRVKAFLRQIDLAQARSLTSRALEMEDAAAVRDMVRVEYGGSML
ncbi:MAG: phosphoenolpyruvate--protein phosphotransferase [Chloroflexota bacterium]|nr:MAG: phosphoenolpyruvate--protein phosphotransferase [Chloroflexota bacterium]